MNLFQFIRVEAQSQAHLQGVLNEADRVDGFCSHVDLPKRPLWGVKKRLDVEHAVAQYMSLKRPVRAKNGRTYLRKPRADSRCLTTIIATYPTKVSEMKASPESIAVFRKWSSAVISFVDKELNGHLVAMCLHIDEEYPHFHFFAVGPCQHVHPGLRAEMVDGALMKDRQARVKAHRAELSAFQNRFFAEVSVLFEHRRKSETSRGMRIRERELYWKRKELEAQAKATGDYEKIRMFDGLYSVIRGSTIAPTHSPAIRPIDTHGPNDRPAMRG